MSEMSVTGLFRYPVKSMMGERLSQLPLSERGVPGDRAWAVRDEERGGIRGAKRFAGLMNCRAEYDVSPAVDGSSPARITLPSGESIWTGDDDVSQKLSNALDSPVTLWPLMPADALDHYRRGAPLVDDMETELRRVFGRLPDEPLPDLTAFPPELFEFESPVGTYFDAFPLLVLTQQSLDTLQATTTSERFDVRRFRPNILVDAPEMTGFPETEWEGRQLKIGSAVLQLEVRCPRCVMTTHGFDDLPKAPGIMRKLVQEAEGNLGIYASVVEPGVVSQVDAVELI